MTRYFPLWKLKIGDGGRGLLVMQENRCQTWWGTGMDFLNELKHTHTHHTLKRQGTSKKTHGRRGEERVEKRAHTDRKSARHSYTTCAVRSRKMCSRISPSLLDPRSFFPPIPACMHACIYACGAPSTSAMHHTKLAALSLSLSPPISDPHAEQCGYHVTLLSPFHPDHSKRRGEKPSFFPVPSFVFCPNFYPPSFAGMDFQSTWINLMTSGRLFFPQSIKEFLWHLRSFRPSLRFCEDNCGIFNLDLLAWFKLRFFIHISGLYRKTLDFDAVQRDKDATRRDFQG